MPNPRFEIPKATLVYDDKGEPVELYLNGEPFPAAISAHCPISVDFNAEANFQTITMTFFVRDFTTKQQDQP